MRSVFFIKVGMILFVGICRQSQVVGTTAHPSHSHSHHGHPAHLSPGGGGGGRSPTGGPVVGSTQHLGQPLYQEYTHVRPRAHPVPPPVYVTAAPSQAPPAIQQQQVPTYQGFTPGWVPRHLVDACMCVPFIISTYSSLIASNEVSDLVDYRVLRVVTLFLQESILQAEERRFLEKMRKAVFYSK